MQQLRPTFSESWYRVANLRAKLRSSAQISRQFYRGDRWYVVRDPAGNQFHRLSAPAYRFVGLLDGTRTVAEAWDLVGGQLADEAPTQNEVIQILSQLTSANLLESNVTPDAAVLLRRHKRMVKRQWQGRLMNVLFPRIPLIDPDWFLRYTMSVMRWFFSLGGMLLWLVVIGMAVAAIVPEWGRLAAQAGKATDPGNWPFLWLSFVLIKAIHEMGHAYVCRRYGGEVHEMGVMFLVFVPTPYVDASSAWAFPSKWARVFVGAGGMYIELFIAALMAFVFLNTGEASTIHDLAYNIMLVASVSTVIFNANPLLRYDGYYILSDLLEIPNLRYRATEYSMGLIKRHLFRVKSQNPLPPGGQRVWLLLYSVLSSIYRVFVGVMIIFVVWNKVPVLGVLMALGGVITWLVVPVVKTLNYLLLEPELHRKRVRATVWVTAMTAAAVFGVLLIPTTPHYEATAILRPKYQETLTAKLPGQVVQIAAMHGQWVKKGDLIVKLRDEDMEREMQRLKNKWEQSEVTRSAASALAAHTQDKDERSKANADAKTAEKEMEGYERQMERLQTRLDELEIRAPFDGMVVAPRLHELTGKFLKQSEIVAIVADPRELIIPARIPQSDAGLPLYEKEVGVEARLAGDPTHSLPCRVMERTPTVQSDVRHQSDTFAGGGTSATDPHNPTQLVAREFEYVLELDNADGAYVPGQRAYVRFSMADRPLVWQATRKVLQVIQTKMNSKWF